MKKIATYLLYILKNWYKWWVKLLTIIGDVKIYKTPCFVLYNNEEYDYKVRGNDIRNVCEQLLPGDIILRGYNHYLDGWLIPGKYSHAGIYIGDNKIIHAISKGVTEIDTIDYMQCDRLLVLRPTSGSENAVEYAKSNIGSDYDFKFNNSDSSAFYCFELVAKAYSQLAINPEIVTIFNIELKFLTEKYTANSFINNCNFNHIIEINN